MPKVLDDSKGSIGSFDESMLTEVQYQALHGTGWILSDGRSVVGSKYASITGATIAPDARGQILRGKNNSRADGQQDPAGERTLGAQQSDAMQGHWHTLTGYQRNTAPGTSNIVEGQVGGELTSTDGFAKGQISDGANGTPRITTETRVKNIACNIFLRIN